MVCFTKLHVLILPNFQAVDMAGEDAQAELLLSERRSIILVVIHIMDKNLDH